MHVSLIHGARRLHRLRPNRQWMVELRRFLLDGGAADVSCFAWSGGIVAGLRTVDAERYAADLADDYARARANGGSLSIVAKSFGGLIAERALMLLQHEIALDLFLRIGVPDVRTTLPLTNVSRVVNVISLGDRLFRGARPVMRVSRSSRASGHITPATIEFRALSHFALTQLTPLDGEGRPGTSTYDLYWSLLRSATEGTDTVGR